MASTSEIRRRIGGVRQTQKITHAMYLISQAKLRKAKQDLDNTRPYFQALQTEIGRVFNADSTIESRYVDPVDPNAKPLPGVPACLLITADKGLAGAYNQNAIRQAQQLLTAHGDAALYVVGEYGRRWFSQRGIAIEESFHYTAQNPTLDRSAHRGAAAGTVRRGRDQRGMGHLYRHEERPGGCGAAGEDPADAPGALSRRRGGCRRG